MKGIPYLSTAVSAALVLIYITQSNGIKYLRLNAFENWKQNIVIALSASVVLFLVCTFLIAPLLEDWTGLPIEHGPFRQLEGNVYFYLLSLAIAWVMGGFVEELVFRGFMFNQLNLIIPGNPGKVFALIFTSVLFGYLHTYQGLTGQLLTGFFGLMLAFTYLLSNRNLWINVVIHGSINTISLTGIFLGWL